MLGYKNNKPTTTGHSLFFFFFHQEEEKERREKPQTTLEKPMLAQNFKSAADLGISDKVYEALKKTLVLFETGKVMWQDVDSATNRGPDEDNNSPITFHFNMDQWAVKHDCGTIRCIGGMAEAIGRFRFTEWGGGEIMPPELESLFYPLVGMGWNKITVEQSAQALRNYLTTGQSQWNKVMESDNG